MIRPAKQITEICRCCKRDGYTHMVPNSLLTQDEWDKIFKRKCIITPKIENLPNGYEQMGAGGGSPSINDSIQEAKEYCADYNIPGVGFDFNGITVLVTAHSNVNKIYRDWWQKAHHETPEQSAAKR